MTWMPGEPVRLETPRFIVRSLEMKDVSERMARWASDPEIMELVAPDAGPMTVLQLKRQIKGFNNKASFILGIFNRDDALHIGNYRVYCNPKNRSAQTNVVIGDRAFWGQGVAIETRAAILDFLFSPMNIEKVWGVPYARNFASLFNYKAQGFRCEGIMLQNHRLADGTRIDQYYFGLMRDEWLRQRDAGGARP